jgi:hypothetical protein
MLENGWDLASDFLQNDPRNGPYMGLEASHFIGEISTGMYGGIYDYACMYVGMDG